MALSQAQDERLSDLMKQSQKGDPLAYELLLKDVYLILKGFIEHKIGRCEVWEDVLQDILISIHKARHTFDVRKPFAPWMYAIARYRMADYWRKSFRNIEDRMTEEMELTAAAPDEKEVSISMGAKLSAALERLPEKQRQAVDFLKIKGLSIRETAKEMKMSESAVKITAHRAYKMLRQKFEDQSYGYE